MSNRFSLEAILDLRDGFTGPMNRFRSNLTRTSRETRQQVEAISAGFRRMNHALNVGLLAAGAGVAAAAGYGVRASMQLSDAMARVGTIADTSVLSLESMRDAVIGVSDRTGQGVNTVADAVYQAISAGISTVDAVSFVETATRAAVGGFTDAATSVDALTSMLNAYGLQASEATRLSDQLLAAQNFGKTTFAEIGQSIGNVVPIASQLGVASDELLASISTLTRQGQPTATAMTGVRAALSNILRPSAQAAELATQLGLDFSAAALESRGLAGFLNDVTEATGGSNEQMARLFGSTEALNAILTLTGGGADDFRAALDSIRESSGATGSAFETIASSPGERFRRTMNRMRNAALRLGDALSPAIAAATDFVDAIGNRLGEIGTERIEEFVTNMVAGIKEFGRTVKRWWDNGVIPGILAGVVAFKVLMPVVTGVVAAFRGFQAIKAAGGILSFLASGPIGLIVGAIAGLIAVTVLVVKHWDTIKAVAATAWGGIVEYVTGVWQFFRDFGSWLVEFFRPIGMAIAQPFVDAFDFLKQAVLGVWDMIQPIIDAVVTGVEAVGNFFNRREGNVRTIEDGRRRNAEQYGMSVPDYYNPDSRVAESRSYTEHRSRVDVWAHAARGSGGISTTPDGVPVHEAQLGYQ